MSDGDKSALSNLMHEERHFDPPEELARNANVKADVYEEADRDPVAFWGKQAERLTWAEDPAVKRLLDVVASILAEEYVQTVRQHPDMFSRNGGPT